MKWNFKRAEPIYIDRRRWLSMSNVGKDASYVSLSRLGRDVRYDDAALKQCAQKQFFSVKARTDEKLSSLSPIVQHDS